MLIFFFFNDTATTEIYTLSLHDALPIFRKIVRRKVMTLLSGEVGDDEPPQRVRREHVLPNVPFGLIGIVEVRSEEHTSELQSQSNLVCRLLLEKKKNKKKNKKHKKYIYT